MDLPYVGRYPYSLLRQHLLSALYLYDTWRQYWTVHTEHEEWYFILLPYVKQRTAFTHHIDRCWVHLFMTAYALLIGRYFVR